MQASIYNALFLSGTRGEFENSAGEKVEFQRADFYIKGESSQTFTVDREIDVNSLVELAPYDLVVEINSRNFGNARGFSVRVVEINAS